MAEKKSTPKKKKKIIKKEKIITKSLLKAKKSDKQVDTFQANASDTRRKKNKGK